jgi:hypothetical protein
MIQAMQAPSPAAAAAAARRLITQVPKQAAQAAKVRSSLLILI